MDVYYHYTIYKGRKCVCVTDASQTHLFKYEVIEATLKEEKDDANNISRPIALNFYKPER
jgi:hypothetical protein